jgi:transcriptional regulator with XRE-family HTH domain
VERKKEYVRNDEKIKAFGRRLRFIRQEKGMGMQELADLSNIEYSQISRIERGIINTSLSNIFILSEVLDTPIKDFFEDLDKQP